MTCSTTSLNKAPFFLAALLAFVLGGCAHGAGGAGAVDKAALIAVLPAENLSATEAPLKDIRRALIERLKARGVAVMDEDRLEKFMARHRLRYTGGLDGAALAAFKDEEGVEAALVTNLELYSALTPPKLALLSRLVRTGTDPDILWMDGAGMAGDDSPGLLGLGLINDPKVLTARAIDRLAGSAAACLRGGEKPAGGAAGPRRFRPKFFYRDPGLDGGQGLTVAVVPLFNFSGRKNAGDMLMLHLVRGLSAVKGLKVVEPGIVREKLLKHRVVMDEGLNMDMASQLLDTLDADLVLIGSVLNYEDTTDAAATPKVDFTVQMVGKKDPVVVWESKSYNGGDDGVYFFDRGRITVAATLAGEMVKNIVAMMFETRDR